MSRYVGARYVPLYEGIWDNTKAYEPLTVVTYVGNSYTSKKYVPVGVNISNTEYWVMSGEYNQQMANINAELQAQASDIRDLQEDNTRLQGEIDDLDSARLEHETAIQELETTTQNLVRTTQQHTTKIGNLEDDVDGLDTRVKNMPKTIANRFMVMRKEVNLGSVPAGGSKIATSESISQRPDLVEIGVVGFETTNPNCTVTSCYLSGTNTAPTVTARVHNNDTEHPANCGVEALVLYLNVIAN